MHVIKISYPQKNEILFLRGEINYTEFHLVNGKKVVSSTTLLRHQERLDGFLRVSRKHLVNPEFVKEIKKDNKIKFVVLLSGHILKVSRRKNSKIN